MFDEDLVYEFIDDVNIKLIEFDDCDDKWFIDIYFYIDIRLLILSVIDGDSYNCV